MSTDEWGIVARYTDAMDQERQAPESTIRAIRSIMQQSGELPRERPVRIVKGGQRIEWPKAGQLILEDGTTLPAKARLPSDLPNGYHRFVSEDGELDWLLIASPSKCVLPKDQPGWGWAVQLYAARSHSSWGMGDLGDLARIARWSSSLGATLLLVNPLHAAAPSADQQSSPYYPSSRRFRNPLYIAIEQVPGADGLREALEPLVAAGRALNERARIDRSAVFPLKMRALEQIFDRVAESISRKLDEYVAREGEAIEQFGCYCALAEIHGSDWRQWPSEFRRPEGAAVRRFTQENARRIRFHQWLQWVLDRQLATASEGLAVLQDLPIGVDPGGADAWTWQDVLASGVSVGAPPDLYNTRGQNWGLPPWIPHRLRALHYRPFIETIRATLRHAGGLRVDHALGLFRLFWIPSGMSPVDGAYVRYPYDELLAILALESERAQAFIVGEDLGTVEPMVREELRRHQILSYRVLWFEEERPSRYPKYSLAAVNTHDLPTIAGLWTGQDLEAQLALGLEPNVEGTNAIRARLARMIRLPDDAPVDEVVARTHALLAKAKSMVVTATLDDALSVVERPNMPATVDVWPNWSIPLPKPLEEIEQDARVLNIARTLNARRSPAPAAAPVRQDAPEPQPAPPCHRPEASRAPQGESE